MHLEVVGKSIGDRNNLNSINGPCAPVKIACKFHVLKVSGLLVGRRRAASGCPDHTSMLMARTSHLKRPEAVG